jgi:hypothetical protein
MDTQAGGLWDLIRAMELEGSDFGIVCLTPDNLESRWMNFEAGALSKAMTKARVVPLLFHLENPDVGLPLSRFQMKHASREEILDTVKAINANAEPGRRVDEVVLLGTFNSVWPKLEARLNEMPPGPEAPRRPDRELLEEILELIRRDSTYWSSFLRKGRLQGDPSLWVQGSIRFACAINKLREVGGPDGSVEISGKSVITVRSKRHSDSADRLFSFAQDLLKDSGMRVELIKVRDDDDDNAVSFASF